MSEGTKLFLQFLSTLLGGIVTAVVIFYFTRLSALPAELAEIKTELKHLTESSKVVLSEDRAKLLLHDGFKSHSADCRDHVLSEIKSELKLLRKGPAAPAA